MSDRLSIQPTGDPGLPEHTHHWMIGNQDGPSSPGVCKECGERRDFSNGFTRRKPMWSRGSQQNAPDGAKAGADSD